jgi:hypothetical protein
MSAQTKGTSKTESASTTPHPQQPKSDKPTSGLSTSPVSPVITPTLQRIAQLFANDPVFGRQLFSNPSKTLQEYGFEYTPGELAVIEAFANTRQLLSLDQFKVQQECRWWIDD